MLLLMFRNNHNIDCNEQRALIAEAVTAVRRIYFAAESAEANNVDYSRETNTLMIFDVSIPGGEQGLRNIG